MLGGITACTTTAFSSIDSWTAKISLSLVPVIAALVHGHSLLRSVFPTWQDVWLAENNRREDLKRAYPFGTAGSLDPVLCYNIEMPSPWKGECIRILQEHFVSVQNACPVAGACNAYRWPKAPQNCWVRYIHCSCDLLARSFAGCMNIQSTVYTCIMHLWPSLTSSWAACLSTFWMQCSGLSASLQFLERGKEILNPFNVNCTL